MIVVKLIEVSTFRLLIITYRSKELKQLQNYPVKAMLNGVGIRLFWKRLIPRTARELVRSQ